jgi:thiamine-monophosphate kinase
MANNRIGRINEEIQRELADLMRSLKDPRLQSGLLTITHVDTTPDLRYSRIFVSALDKSQEKEMTTQAGKYKHILESYLSPQIKPDILDRFFDDKIFPAKGYFVSKGLGSAILQLTQDTGYGAKVYLERIPISSRTFAMAEEINMDPITAAMNGGDDYKFIFTIPIEKHEEMLRDFQDYDIIGHLAQPEVGAAMVTPEGAEIPIRAQGF